MPNRRGNLANGQRTSQTPPRIRCVRCKSVKPADQYTDTKIRDLLEHMSQTPNFNPVTTGEVLCKPCAPGQSNEMFCQGCDRWLPKTRFSKVMRRTPDNAHCIPCMADRANVLPGTAGGSDSASSSGGDSDEDSDSDDGYGVGIESRGTITGTSTAFGGLSLAGGSSSAGGGGSMQPSSTMSSGSGGGVQLSSSSAASTTSTVAPSRAPSSVLRTITNVSSNGNASSSTNDPVASSSGWTMNPATATTASQWSTVHAAPRDAPKPPRARNDNLSLAANPRRQNHADVQVEADSSDEDDD